jgi:hypothetical protein
MRTLFFFGFVFAPVAIFFGWLHYRDVLPNGFRIARDRGDDAIVDRRGWVTIGSNRGIEGPVDCALVHKQYVMGVTQKGMHYILDTSTGSVLVIDPKAMTLKLKQPESFQDNGRPEKP